MGRRESWIAVALLLLGAGVASAEAVRVTASTLNVRSSPSTNAGVLRQIASGQVYPSVGRQGEWHQLQLGGQLGWCHGDYLAATQDPVQSVTASTLNVRSGPGTGYRTLGTLSRGLSVAVVGRSGDWAQLWYRGEQAWVHADFLGSGGGNNGGGNNGGGNNGGGDRPVSAAGFIQLPASGPGFYTYTASTGRWGVPRLIYAAERVGRRLVQEGRPRMGVGNISKQNGGNFPPHSSHRLGVDIDVRPARTSGEGPVTISDAAYSRERTRRMIELFRAEISTRTVLFNDSGISGVTYYSGHHNHFHLRCN